MKKLRCAIYTRKSSEDGLEQEFNSLDAQREACAAYIASQKHEGWVLLPEQYDDGGLSGGSLERPALKQLLQDIADGLVDQIVVYKIDRLTRSLADFSKIVDTLDAAEASFVSVTQSFNTATSMGRLTLNMLLSFAQFEREVTAERIRDKIAASKRRGLWMGGLVPLGYDADGRTLKINAMEAKTIRMLYDLYEQHGTVRAVKAAADDLRLRSRQRTSADGQHSGGITFSRGHIHNLLTNPIYAGRIRHKANVHDGQHSAIIDPDRWERIQQMLQDGAAKGRARKTAKQRSLLCEKLFDETGDRLTPSHSKTKAGERLRYYVSHRLIRNSGEANTDGWRLPAEELEAKVAHVLRQHLNKSSFIGKVVPDASASAIATARAKVQVISVRKDIKPSLDLIERIDLRPGEVSIFIKAEKLGALLEQDLEDLPQDHLIITAPFQLRKRGVETKLIFADAPGARDEALIKNIATAHHWFEKIKSGKSFGQIAVDEGTSTRRIHQMIELALLAPDLIRGVLNGTQPLGFTSDWCLRHSIPSDWSEQRALLATL
ncbi:recombinase family protein [Sulfitobacter sp. MF3-043]|uniref:recombinase family protein n=1 Tax=Sulfitobacter sediminivivens TaxID=3252902 RepID=UPI0036DC7749